MTGECQLDLFGGMDTPPPPPRITSPSPLTHREMAALDAEAAQIIAPTMDVRAERSAGVKALELLTTWQGNLHALIHALPDYVYLPPTNREFGRRALGRYPRWTYCLSPAADGRPGSFPVVCIAWHRKDLDIGGTCRNAIAGDGFQALLVFADGNEITGNAMFNSQQWVIVGKHAVYDMAGRYMRARDAV